MMDGNGKEGETPREAWFMDGRWKDLQFHWLVGDRQTNYISSSAFLEERKKLFFHRECHFNINNH